MTVFMQNKKFKKPTNETNCKLVQLTQCKAQTIIIYKLNLYKRIVNWFTRKRRLNVVVKGVIWTHQNTAWRNLGHCHWLRPVDEAAEQARNKSQ